MSEEQINPQAENNGHAAAEVVDAAVGQSSGANLAELEARLAKAEAQAAEFKDQWLRATADYKNFKRRSDTERAELIRSAGAGVLLKLLPVMDDFDRAIANIPPEIAESAWWGGTQLIAQKLRTLLESEGVKAIPAVGTEFDPNVHEAVLYEDAAGQDGMVVEELQRGYKLHERVLRPAMVKVGRG
ncbi:GrpE protein [Oscillochloris trichoides DG-6]|uniref:Protein GrpE n=1 Tax=Oscillochloris trichoides DG-6 TaxID=765420 RepID=E1I9Z9_9CHLR|nr:nucleotide exchange factor GrpE [Oscillochloris trichoides]EFO82001.1 GrpE protein [Oscillochloris trichoides DG-6]